MMFKWFGCYLKTILFLGLAMQSLLVTAGTIEGSKHDLSSSGSGGRDEICVFCHTPHGANDDLDNDGNPDADHAERPPAPLWNRVITSMATFSMYKSDTLNSDCDATPSPLSLVCLSCHDSAGNMSFDGTGTLNDGAMNSDDTHFLVNEPNRSDIFGTQELERNCGVPCHDYSGYTKVPKFWEIGPDLTDDHPISMSYPTPAMDPDFWPPDNADTGWSDVRLFNGRVECPSCHNPHDPDNVPFLRKTMVGSALCFACHNK